MNIDEPKNEWKKITKNTYTFIRRICFTILFNLISVCICTWIGINFGCSFSFLILSYLCFQSYWFIYYTKHVQYTVIWWCNFYYNRSNNPPIQNALLDQQQPKKKKKQKKRTKYKNKMIEKTTTKTHNNQVKKKILTWTKRKNVILNVLK